MLNPFVHYKRKYLDPPLTICEQLFPPAGDTVDNRVVREHIPNMGSISATFTPDEYTMLSGVRVVSMKLMDQDYQPTRDARTLSLAEEIRVSKEINPLIVAVDREGPYILEGGHRYDALQILGASRFPALVLIENSATCKKG